MIWDKSKSKKEVPGMDWQELEKACLQCRKCALHETRTNVVFGVGKKDAEVMFIGEGPGENEDLQGEPFVGRGGQLLDQMLEIIDLDRKKNIYIANIVKCRPPKNRDPLNTEQEACTDWLRQQYALIRPKVVICLGRIAAMQIIKPDFKITKEHGLWFEKDGVFFTAIYHPAALLRDPGKRPETFVDLKTIQEKIREVCERTYG
jgi:uracil-DNA glycosylase family 4